MRKKVEITNVQIRQATVRDTKVISNIHASSWKIAYKGIVPQRYLDELKDDFWVSAFQNWISNNILTAQIVYDNAIPVAALLMENQGMKSFQSGEILFLLMYFPVISERDTGRNC
ncbi:hypothetical protein N752_12930 [Desulforamulus aquiferis]|nr:hypothetical protein [Desulforamulus aquiferis]RYD04824.1 hypothetical protein N752_12930 [Desulforamulus aquiferis]